MCERDRQKESEIERKRLAKGDTESGIERNREKGRREEKRRRGNVLL